MNLNFSGAASFTSQNKLWLLAHYMIGAGKIIENCPMCGVKLTGE